MNLGSLAPLGKIAGIGGIALGVVALLGDKLVSAVAGLPLFERAPVIQTLTYCCFGIGALGLFAWLMAARVSRTSVSTQGNRSPAVLSGGNVAINAGAAAPLTARKTGKGTTPAGPQGVVRTSGDDSAAVNALGSASINTNPPPTP